MVPDLLPSLLKTAYTSPSPQITRLRRKKKENNPFKINLLLRINNSILPILPTDSILPILTTKRSITSYNSYRYLYKGMHHSLHPEIAWDTHWNFILCASAWSLRFMNSIRNWVASNLFWPFSSFFWPVLPPLTFSEHCAAFAHCKCIPIWHSAQW